MEIPILSELLIILGLSVVVILFFQRFKLPTILGFLITGIVAGPHALGFIEASHEVEILAEIGVILLLFIIGLEFSLKSLAAIKFTVLIGGALQVGVTILVTIGFATLLDFSLPEATFLGFLFSLSSTAIVLKLLNDRGEMSTPHGKVALAILIFQDIIVVPMILFTPLIAGGTEEVSTTLLWLLVKVVAIVLILLISARYIVPKLLFFVARTRSRELFILTIVVICFSVAWLTSYVGLSLALGALFAGLIISESEYSHQATSNIIPFREIFTSFFFVSIGMLMDLNFLWDHLGWILLITLTTMVIKGLIAAGATRVLKYPKRTVSMVGLSIFQVGEFAFILSATGMAYNLLSDDVYQYFLSISILSMAVTPFILGNAGSIATWISLKGSREKKYLQKPEDSPLNELENHLVIIGYGVNGRNVAHAARDADIPYVIVDLNPNTVKTEMEKGEKIIFGDAVEPFILEHLHINNAKVAVIAVSDPMGTKKIVTAIRSISKTVHIISRTRFMNEVEENLDLGADEVIPEEFETSVEILTRVLNKFLIPIDVVEEFTRKIRADNYEMLRYDNSLKWNQNVLKGEIPGIDIICMRVDQPDEDIVGKTILDSQLRQKYEVTLLAIKRNDEVIVEITGDTKIKQHDLLYLFGNYEKIMALHKKLKV